MEKRVDKYGEKKVDKCGEKSSKHGKYGEKSKSVEKKKRVQHQNIHLRNLYCVHIRKTCPCNVYPLKPHFYIVKLGYTGVYLFFLFLLQNIDCGYSLEPPRRGSSNMYPQSMF